MIDDESDQIPKPEGMLSLELKQKRLQAEGKDLYGREAYELQFLSIRWIDKKMIRERQKKREAQLALRERWKNSVKVDEKKAETFLERVKKRLLRLVLGEKAVSRSMKGKGDPAFEKRMKVLNLARTCFMIMDADDSGTLSRDEILTAVKEDKRVLGFLRECKEEVLRDLMVPEKLEENLEKMDTDKSGAVWKSTSASGAPDNSSLSHFSAMARPSWLGRAVRNEHHHAIEQASRRWRGGRRDDAARTRHKILISTQVGRN